MTTKVNVLPRFATIKLMTFRFATDPEVLSWDELLRKNPDGGNVFASREMAEAKTASGWTPRYVVSDDDSLAILALEKSIPLLGKFWYLPKGPGVTSAAELAPILAPLKAFAAAHGAFVVKIEPEILRSEQTRADLAKLGLERTFAVQPNASTVLVDLAPSEDEILASLNQKGRNAIRRAMREGAVAEAVPLTDENMKIMYDLLRITAEGQWNLRSFDYFKRFWTTFADKNMGQMFFTRYDGEVVAASFGLLLGNKATYKDGCSIRKRTVYGASHLLQWEMMRWMKAHGATSYDLCGTPPSEAIHDPNHHFAGLARFKTSFNKHVTDYVGCYNLPVKKMQYDLWQNIVERVVLRLHNMQHHTEWY